MSQVNVNAAIAKFVKNFTQTAEAELEKKIRRAIEDGKLKGHETFSVGVQVDIEKIDLHVTIYTKIEL